MCTDEALMSKALINFFVKIKRTLPLVHVVCSLSCFQILLFLTQLFPPKGCFFIYSTNNKKNPLKQRRNKRGTGREVINFDKCCESNVVPDNLSLTRLQKYWGYTGSMFEHCGTELNLKMELRGIMTQIHNTVVSQNKTNFKKLYNLRHMYTVQWGKLRQ
jgi:hypothetical protein